MLPAKRRDVGEQLVGDCDALGTELADRLVEVDGIPVDDGCRQQAEAGCPKALVLEGTVTELALPVEKHGPAQRVAGLTLV